MSAFSLENPLQAMQQTAVTPGSLDFGASAANQLGITNSPNPLNGALNRGISEGFSPVTGQQDILSKLGGLFGGGEGGGFGSLSGYGDLLGGAASVFSAYTGYKNMKLAKEQLDFTKKSTNRNIENQAAVTNEALRARSNARSAFGGKKTTPTQVSGAPL